MQPVFYCRRCPFDWALDVCRSNTSCADMDYELLVGPLLARDQDCSEDSRLMYAATLGAFAQRLLQQSIIEYHAGCPEMLLDAQDY